MNRRNFFRALSALAALPLVPKVLKGKTPDYPPGALSHLYLWSIPNDQKGWLTANEARKLEGLRTFMVDETVTAEFDLFL
jgi:hypothetical protein